MPTFNLGGWSRLRQRLSPRSSATPNHDQAHSTDRPDDDTGHTRQGDMARQQDQELVYSLAPSRIPSPAQLKHIFTVLSAGERQRLQWWLTIAAMSLLALGISFLSRHVQLLPRSGGTLTEGVIGAPQTVNPLLSRANSVDQELVALTFRGLTKIDQDGRVVPDVATAVTPSVDTKQFTVELPADSRWSDGEILNANDVRFTYDTVLDADYKSRFRSLFTGMELEVVNDRKIIMKFAQAQPDLLQYLTLGLLPEHVWADTSPDGFPLAELNVKPVGNGPYRFHSLTKDRDGNILGYHIVRNKYYHDAAPFIEKFQFKFYPDQDAALEALKNNSIDVFGGTNVGQRSDQIKDRPVTTAALDQLTAVFFNQRQNPALKVKEVRQALALASDRNGIVQDILHDFGTVINSPILPGSLGHAGDVKKYDFSIEAANALLDKAEWKRNDKGIRQKGPQLLTFTFSTVDDPIYLEVARQLMEDWKTIGAQVELKTFDSRRIQRDIIRPREYEAILFGQMYDIDSDPYPFWHSSQIRESGFNLAIYFNKAVDQDLEQARKATNDQDKIAKYRDFQNIVAEEVPAIFLYQPQYLYVHPKNLRGIPADRLSSGHDRFRSVEHWYLNTRIGWTNKKKDS